MTKTIPQIKIVNVETGEEITRDANAEELAQMQKDETTEQARKTNDAQKAAEKEALLAKLGITADEAKLLLA
jgi:hypothetical protein